MDILPLESRKPFANAMRRKCMWTLTFLAIAFATGRAQTPSGQQPADAGEPSQTAPMPDQATESQTGQEQQPADTGEPSQTPPMLDQETETQMGQQPGDAGEPIQTAPISVQIQSEKISNPMWVTEPSPYELMPNRRSYMVAGITLAESSEFIPANSPASSLQDYSATRLYATLALLKIIRRFTTSINYKGGGFFYRDTGTPWSATEVQQMTAAENISWQRTHLLLEDSLSDYPGASFGSSAFGGASSYNLGFGGSSSGISDFFGFNDYGGLGEAPHFTNVALAQVTQELTPRAGISLAGAYAITDYLGHGNSVNSQQASGEAAYNYLITPRTQFGVAYGYQNWRFPGGGSTDANTVQLFCGHTLSSRMTIGIGGGPQRITSHTPEEIVIGPVHIPVTVTSHQTGITADATLGYTMGRGSLGLYYEHLLTGGSGLFAGATSDVISLSYTRPILRAWATSFAAGWSRLANIGSRSSGIPGNSYQYGFVSAGISRSLGRHVSVSASYQFNDETNTSGCTASSGCGSVVHTASFTVAWRTSPIHLDRGNDLKGDAVTAENPQTDIQNPLPTPP